MELQNLIRAKKWEHFPSIEEQKTFYRVILGWAANKESVAGIGYIVAGFLLALAVAAGGAMSWLQDGSVGWLAAFAMCICFTGLFIINRVYFHRQAVNCKRVIELLAVDDYWTAQGVAMLIDKNQSAKIVWEYGVATHRIGH